MPKKGADFTFNKGEFYSGLERDFAKQIERVLAKTPDLSVERSNTLRVAYWNALLYGVFFPNKAMVPLAFEFLPSLTEFKIQTGSYEMMVDLEKSMTSSNDITPSSGYIEGVLKVLNSEKGSGSIAGEQVTC